jgi:hypothetical protein
MKSILKPTIFFIILILISTTLLAQAPDTLWTKTYGGINYDSGNTVQQTSDGGYIIVGMTVPFNENYPDVFLIKTDAGGDTLWTKTFGDTLIDIGNFVQQTSDGGYIITGYTKGVFSSWLGSFWIHSSKVWLIKTNSSGDTLWTKTLGTSPFNAGISVQQTLDGGYIVLADSGSFGGEESGGYTWLLKTDASGDTLWTKTFGECSAGVSHNNFCSSIQQTTDGGFVLAGYSDYPDGNEDIWIIKTDFLGDTLWTSSFGTTNRDYANCVQQTTDGGYILVGIKGALNNSADIWLIKTDALGDTLWTRTFAGDYALGHSVQQTSDGGYILIGSTGYASFEHDDWLIKTDNLGNIQWTKTFGGSNEDLCTSVQKTSDGGYVLTGRTSSYGAGGSDVWLIKTAAEPSHVENKNPNIIPVDYVLKQNYPNPFNPSTTIEFNLPKSEYVELKVYNILGKEVSTLVSNKLNQGNHTYTFDGKNLASGIYYYQLTAGDFREVKKMILIR